MCNLFKDPSVYYTYRTSSSAVGTMIYLHVLLFPFASMLQMPLHLILGGGKVQIRLIRLAVWNTNASTRMRMLPIQPDDFAWGECFAMYHPWYHDYSIHYLCPRVHGKSWSWYGCTLKEGRSDPGVKSSYFSMRVLEVCLWVLWSRRGIGEKKSVILSGSHLRACCECGNLILRLTRFSYWACFCPFH